VMKNKNKLVDEDIDVNEDNDVKRIIELQVKMALVRLRIC